MIRLAITILIALSLFTLSGCNNLSPSDNFNPQLDQRLDSIEGNQATIENNQNAIKLELGRLQNSLSIQGENNEVQQGWLNVQADGIIIAVFALSTIGLLLFFMWKSKHYKETAEILLDQIRAYDDWELKERVMAAAWNTKVEKTVFRMVE